MTIMHVSLNVYAHYVHGQVPHLHLPEFLQTPPTKALNEETIALLVTVHEATISPMNHFEIHFPYASPGPEPLTTSN